MTKCAPALLLIAWTLAGQPLTPAWVELGEGGRAIARVIVARSEDCPRIETSGGGQSMSLRSPVPPGFRPACEAVIPPGTRSARVNGQALSLPRRDPAHIVAVGDTGCRIQGPRLQDCNDPAKWPFRNVANAAAHAKPDLAIHVGDYLYREDPCPANAQSQCGGSPSGDNWGAWNADFFEPANKLLAAAPWVFSRGNHENCTRSWRGWFYYLDPRPWRGACEQYSQPYSIELGKFQMVAFDSSGVREDQVSPDQLNLYTAQLSAVHARDAWLIDHHPFWAVSPGAPGRAPVAQTEVLQQAWDRASPQGIDLVLSGHTHLFELLNYGSGRPLQVVAGDGGTNLADPITEPVNGVDVHGMMVTASQNRREFGYTVFTRRGAAWEMTLRDVADRPLVTCRIERREARCSGRVLTLNLKH